MTHRRSVQTLGGLYTASSTKTFPTSLNQPSMCASRNQPSTPYLATRTNHLQRLMVAYVDQTSLAPRVLPSSWLFSYQLPRTFHLQSLTVAQPKPLAGVVDQTSAHVSFPTNPSYPKPYPNLHISFPTPSTPIRSNPILLLSYLTLPTFPT